MDLDLQYVNQAVQRLGREPASAIPLLQALQDHFGYLPEEGLRRICETTRIKPAALAGVASFYDMFRHKPAGKNIVRVCHGTACHVTGIERVEAALRRELRIPDGQDTDADRQFTIEPVACLGCCTLAPVMKIGHSVLGHATAEKVPALIHDFLGNRQVQTADTGDSEFLPFPPHVNFSPGRDCNSHEEEIPQINIGLGSCCMAKGSDQVFMGLAKAARDYGVRVHVKRVGCVGMCHRTPIVEVVLPGQPNVLYAGVGPAQAQRIVERHFGSRGFSQRLSTLCRRTLDSILRETAELSDATCVISPKQPEAAAFLNRQVRMATEHFGKTDPLDLDEYIIRGGFAALGMCLENANDETRKSNTEADGAGVRPSRAQQRANACMRQSTPPLIVPEDLAAPEDGHTPPQAQWPTPGQIISLIERSGLRGRGGAGFPTGAKWRLGRQQPGATKYVICNGDEGDPGAFMDRMLLESFPYRIIEGLAIAAVAIGAHEGIFYIRHEYPLAVERVRAAIGACEERGWLGDRLMDCDYSLRLSVMEGAGAFVCGEETALIASLEGKRGSPRLRPPFPVEAGLWGKPTVINNVETLALVPWILRHGPDAFAAFGTASSKGTKVFALAGNIQRGGLIEIPMGITLRQIVEEIGGGVPAGRKFKAVQNGGPSGGCIPASQAATPVDYESLREAGAIMGSGGLIVLDDSACMVDIARYFLKFTQSQSCGKCTLCRIGTRRMLDILERICAGKGRKEDLVQLEHLSCQVGAGSLCGLGKTAPNPVLTTLRYFRDEYEAHLQGRCPAGKCAALIKYQVMDHCTGCTICAQHCPVGAIPMTPYSRHVVDDQKCTRCDSCRQVCPEKAIEVI